MHGVESRPFLPALSGLRYIAVAYVVFFHFYHPSRVPHSWVNHGSDCLAIFFVLSGFVIFYRYGHPEQSGRLDLGNFWASRFSRVYPVYLVALLLSTPGDLKTLVGQGHRTLELVPSWIAAATLLQSWIPAYSSRWNTPGWTLSVEAFLYVLFPFAAPHVDRLYGGVRWIFMALILVLCISVLRLGPSVPLVYLGGFLLGMIAAREFILRGLETRWPWWLSAAPPCLLAFYILLNPIPWSYWHQGVLQVLAALAVYALAVDHSWVGRLLGWHRLAALGEASYALYILQAPVWVWLYYLRTKANWPVSHTLFFFAYFVLLNAIALASYRYFEKPARRWCFSLLGKPATRSATPLSDRSKMPAGPETDKPAPKQTPTAR